MIELTLMHNYDVGAMNNIFNTNKTVFSLT